MMSGTCLLLLLGAAIADPMIFYVKNTGHNSLDCGSPSSPCSTIAGAFSLIKTSIGAGNADFRVILMDASMNVNVTASLGSIAHANATVAVVSGQNQTTLVGDSVVDAFLFNTIGVKIIMENIVLQGFNIAIRNSRPAQLINCGFLDNDVAIYNSNQVFVTNGIFSRNRIALDFLSGSCVLTNVTFENSTGSTSTIMLLQGSNLTIYNGIFRNNMNNGSAYSSILSAEEATFQIYNTTFENNQSPNRSGGAIYSARSTGSIHDSRFYRNSAVRGGAIAIEGGYLLINNTVFTGNSANSTGGAMEIRRATVNVTSTSFHGNSAVNGGAVVVYNNGSLVASFSRCTLEKNYAVQSGADFWMLPNSNITIKDVVMTKTDNAVYCYRPPAVNVTINGTTNGTAAQNETIPTTNIYCQSNCRAPQCSLCTGLCLLDSTDDPSDSGSGDCFSEMSADCNINGKCRLAMDADSKLKFPQCECDATWSGNSCTTRSWLFYVLIVMALLTAAVIVVGAVFTIQNRIRNSSYATLN